MALNTSFEHNQNALLKALVGPALLFVSLSIKQDHCAFVIERKALHIDVNSVSFGSHERGVNCNVDECVGALTSGHMLFVHKCPLLHIRRASHLKTMQENIEKRTQHDKITVV